ncbi:unnamed protein product [Agarophyton chilense]
MGSITHLLILLFILLCSLNESVVVKRLGASEIEHVLRKTFSSLLRDNPSRNATHFAERSRGISRNRTARIVSRVPVSKDGFNSKNYNEFTFNHKFNDTDFTDAPKAVYDANADDLRAALDYMDSTFFLGMPSSAWEEFSAMLDASFQDERGAVFYSILTGKWVFCAWVDMWANKYFMRICASLISFGYSDISRAPIPDQDYITTGAMYQKIYGNTTAVVRKEEPESEPESESDVEPVDRTAIYVDLSEATDPYEETCMESERVIHNDCYAFCCHSLYIGSFYCTDFPLNCV